MLDVTNHQENANQDLRESPLTPPRKPYDLAVANRDRIQTKRKIEKNLQVFNSYLDCYAVNFPF